MKSCLAWSLVLSCAFPSVGARAEELPAIPIGEDAYLHWERWPQLRIGARTWLRSTWDRAGHNEGSDASHFLYMLAEDRNVALDVEGQGILWFARFNRWHGSPWHFVVDGTDHLVTDTSTANPNAPDFGSVFHPAGVFAEPLALPWPVTRGANLTWVPMPFENSLRIEYERTFYGTGYYIFSKFAPGVPLSRPLESWVPSAPDSRVLGLLSSAGSDLVPQAGTPEGIAAGISESGGTVALAPGGRAVLQSFGAGPGMVRAISLSVPEGQAADFGRARLRITWDGASAPSVDAPVDLFFGAGTVYNDDGREWLVRALPVSIRYAGGRVHFACYFPMPFLRSAVVRLENDTGATLSDIQWSIRRAPLGLDPRHVGLFHATHRDHPETVPREHVVFLDTRGVEGRDHWSGHIVGTSFTFAKDGLYEPTEGDPRFYFDGARTPQVQGTGTEEWAGGGDGWWRQRVTLPLVGHPIGCEYPSTASGPRDLVQSAYRFLLADVMPFGDRAVLHFEHGVDNMQPGSYETVVYWYGVPDPSLVRTDTLDVGNPASEAAHQYRISSATQPYTIVSRFDWGPDTVGGVEVYPAHAETARRTGTGTAFTLRIDPSNQGVMLRRTLDYQYPNQRGEVFIADHPGVAGLPPGPGWSSAGFWYTPGSTLGYGSWPATELSPPDPVLQTSNRRFVEDEFLLPLELTRGKSQLRVGIRFHPVNRPLMPGLSLQPQQWTEVEYQAHCFRIPRYTGGVKFGSPTDLYPVGPDATVDESTSRPDPPGGGSTSRSRRRSALPSAGTCGPPR